MASAAVTAAIAELEYAVSAAGTREEALQAQRDAAPISTRDDYQRLLAMADGCGKAAARALQRARRLT